MEDRATREYHVAVTTSDEAFAWQLLTNYYQVWEKELLEDTQNDPSENSLGSGGKAKVGPKKGFKNTAGKTVDKYNEYICLVGRSRKGRNASLWSTSLKQAAQQEKLNREREKQQEEANATLDDFQDEEVYLEHDFMEYTQIDLEDAMQCAEEL